ncbi:MAG: hypothetical protein QF823_00805 [Candidatus Marinimicrobia bacterium]|nr:hypothetical protein [Candidatus Neomarinimicrobiota bacterium]
MDQTLYSYIIFVGFANGINRGVFLLVSDVPVTPKGIKTEESDKEETKEWVYLHLEIGMETMGSIGKEGEQIKHFTY